MSRIEAKSEYFDYYLTIDVNTAIYPIKEDEKFEMMLSDSLYEQKPAAEMKYDASKKLDSRAESFEYIMQGIVFKYSQEKSKAYVPYPFTLPSVSLRYTSLTTCALPVSLVHAAYTPLSVLCTRRTADYLCNCVARRPC